MEEINLPSRRKKSPFAQTYIHTPFFVPPQKIQCSLARYKEIHTSTKVHTMYLRSPIIIKLHYTTNQVPISQYNGSKESPPAPRRKKPPLDLVHFDRPEPCSFITPGFRVYTLFWEPAFSNKSRISKDKSLGHSSLFFFLVELSSCEGMRSRLSDDCYYYYYYCLSLSLSYMFRKVEITLTLLHTHSVTHTYAQGGILCDLTDLPVPTVRKILV